MRTIGRRFTGARFHLLLCCDWVNAQHQQWNRLSSAIRNVRSYDSGRSFCAAKRRTGMLTVAFLLPTHSAEPRTRAAVCKNGLLAHAALSHYTVETQFHAWTNARNAATNTLILAISMSCCYIGQFSEKLRIKTNLTIRPTKNNEECTNRHHIRVSTSLIKTQERT